MYLAGPGPDRRGMSLSQWWLLLSAWVRLLVVDIQLRAVGVQRAARLAPTTTNTDASRAQLRKAETYVHWLRVAARHHVVTARCLHQSLALHTWLRGDGVPSSIEIGVRRAGSQLAAHAWVHV